MSEIPESELEAVTEMMDLTYRGQVISEGHARSLYRAAYPAIREQVLADAKARIEGALVDLTDRHDDDPYLKGYRIARRDALAALTQPQTEKCPDCDDKGYIINRGVCHCVVPDDGGGAATAAGVADADLVRVGDFFGIPAFTHPDVKPGIVGIVSAGEVTAVIADPQEPGPYAKAFRERVCPVPEFPGIEKEDA